MLRQWWTAATTDRCKWVVWHQRLLVRRCFLIGFNFISSLCCWNFCNSSSSLLFCNKWTAQVRWDLTAPSVQLGYNTPTKILQFGRKVSHKFKILCFGENNDMIKLEIKAKKSTRTKITHNSEQLKKPITTNDTPNLSPLMIPGWETRRTHSSAAWWRFLASFKAQWPE